MQKSDVERPFEGRSYGDLVLFGSDVIEDMLAVSQEEADLIKLVKCVGDSSSGALQQGALNALLRMKEPPVDPIKSLYIKVLEKWSQGFSRGVSEIRRQLAVSARRKMPSHLY